MHTSGLDAGETRKAAVKHGRGGGAVVGGQRRWSAVRSGGSVVRAPRRTGEFSGRRAMHPPGERNR